MTRLGCINGPPGTKGLQQMRGLGIIDPSMGALGAYVSYNPTMGLGVDVEAPPPRPPEAAIVPHDYQPSVAAVLYGLFTTVTTAALVYHGYKRNESLGWAIGWGILGGIAPVVALPVALAQGFGEKKKGLTPNRRRRSAPVRRRRKRR